MKVGLLGCGVVGSGVKKLIEKGSTEDLKKIEIQRILVKEKEDENPIWTENVNDILNDDAIECVVECMGGDEPAHTFVKTALEMGKHVVTSNKKMLALHAEELFQTAQKNGVVLRYEASVGGGIPWICELERMLRIDTVSHIEGIMNGTTNYILSSMYEADTDFADALKEAQEKGFAERDPSDDIDGYDVRYKTALSCMTAFGCLPVLSSIPCFGIRAVQKEDMTVAKMNGYRIKLIGQASYEDGKLFASVMPAFVKDNTVFAAVSSNLNVLQAKSDSLGTSAYIGQGAGSLPTAHAVVQDIITVCRKEENTQKDSSGLEVHLQKTSCFYVHGIEVPEDLKEAEYVSSNAVLTKEISFEQLMELLKDADPKTIFVAEVRK